MHRWVPAIVLTAIVVGFLALLVYYGNRLPPPWCDDVFFIQPAENLARGKGMGTPVLDDLMPGIATRTYWQPPVYLLALAAWGKVAGFDLAAMRWFSRLVGALGLVLLFLSARQWGLPATVSLLPVLWVSLDLVYQYRSNIVRMDVLTATLVMATLLVFGKALRKGDTKLFALTGILAALASLCHFVSLPILTVLWITLIVRRDFKALSAFLTPMLLGWSFWLVYAAQDWHAFLTQLRYQFAFRAEIRANALRDLPSLLEWLMMTHWMDFWGILLSNEPPWILLMGMVLVGAAVRKGILAGWQVAVLVAAYLAAVIAPTGALNYLPLFVPLGYLAVTRIFFASFQRHWQRMILLALAALWTGCQFPRFYETVAFVPQLEADTYRFFRGLERHLPKGSTVLLQCFPDPYFHLKRHRPDITIYEMPPHPFEPNRMHRLLHRSDYYVWGGMLEGLRLPIPEEADYWQIRSPWLESYKIWLIPLHSSDRGKVR
jgi:hypothetical protein